MSVQPFSVNMLPTTRWARWLTGSTVAVPDDLRAALISSYLMSAASLVSSAVANLFVSIVAAVRHPNPVFFTLLAFDLGLFAIRVGLMKALRRAAATGTKAPTDLFITSSIAWSSLLGIATVVCFRSGDIVLQVLAPVTMVAIVGGIATRNYGVPRLAIVQILSMDVTYTVGAAMAWVDPWLLVLVAQCPLYMISIISTIFRLHRAFLTIAIAERENEHRATHDALTGLWNRPGLMSALKRNLSRSNRDGRFALFYMDLDGFKAVNDALGHAAGDRLLQLVASRLEQVMPPNSIVARLGGDEFVVLAPALTRDQAETLGGRAIAVASQPFNLEADQPVRIGVSVGLTWADPDLSADELLARADAALYRAKAEGKGRLIMAAASGESEPGLARQRAA